MRGLTLLQPWASLVAIGAKTIETRSWQTSYRGELLISAASRFSNDEQALCRRDPFASVLVDAGFKKPTALPLGVIVAVARLDDVVPTDDISPQTHWPLRVQLGQWMKEQAFGDFSAGRFGWLLRDIKRLTTPIPAAHLGANGQMRPGGALGLWSVPQVVLDLVAGQGVL